MLGAALISGGVSLLSGLLGRSSAKKQAAKEEAAIRKANDVATAQAAQMNKELRARADAAALVPVATSREHAERTASYTAGGVDMGAFMSAAKDYGFNPLTFLRSGALSLFSTQASASAVDTMDWTCTTGERAMDAAMQGSYLPQLQPVIAQTKVPGMGDVLGNALQSGANQYLSDLSQQQNNEFQMSLLNAKLAGANARPSGSPGISRSFYQPQAFLGGSVTTGRGPAAPKGPQPLMIDYIDNRKGSPTYGQIIQWYNPDLSPEAAGAGAMAGTPGNDPITVIYDPFGRREGGPGGPSIVPGSPADTAKDWIFDTLGGIGSLWGSDYDFGPGRQ